MCMQVILLQKVAGLGQTDDIKEVADGYARNFLFPRHLAVQASAQAVHDLSARQKRAAKDGERELHEQQTLAEKIDGLEIELTERTSDKGQLYAAVNPIRVTEALLKKGYTVKKEQVIMKPIKTVGTHPVKIKFRHGLEAEIVVTVSEAK